jgi:citrate synthase
VTDVEIPRGLRGVAVAKSAKSYVDGQAGVFNLCGYDIRDIAEKISFEESTYLLWHGRLPNRKELTDFESEFRAARELPPELVAFLKTVPQDAVPMYTLRTAMSVLGMMTMKELPAQTPAEALAIVKRLAVSLTAKMSMIVPAIQRFRTGQSLPPVRKDLGEAAHFLYQLTGQEPSTDAADAFDTALVLHCDHGFNNSTFTARVVSSSLTDIYSVLVAAIGALNGPLHGGANVQVLPMLEESGDPSRAEAWVLDQLKNKRVVMGIGHPVYKVVDPRKDPLKRMATKLTNRSGAKLIQIAEKVEEVMAREKKLHANVDLYSAPLFSALNIPTDLFTPIFAASRTTGWLAQVMEQLEDNRIYRPESEYVGPPVGREFKPIDAR